MRVTDNFRVTTDGRITLNKYEIVVRRYTSLDKSTYEDDTRFLTEAEAQELKENIVPKHQLLEIVSENVLDNDKYAYMKGLRLRTSDYLREIEEIAGYGSKEAYEASLPSAVDEYLLSLETEIALMQLGIEGSDLE